MTSPYLDRPLRDLAEVLAERDPRAVRFLDDGRPEKRSLARSSLILALEAFDAGDLTRAEECATAAAQCIEDMIEEERRDDRCVLHCRGCGDVAVAQHDTGICKIGAKDCRLGLRAASEGGENG